MLGADEERREEVDAYLDECAQAWRDLTHPATVQDDGTVAPGWWNEDEAGAEALAGMGVSIEDVARLTAGE